MTDTDETPEQDREIRLLDPFLKTLHTVRRGKGPRWLPDTHPDIIYRENSLTWGCAGYKQLDKADMVELDINGAFLAPLSNTELPFNALVNTGPKDFDNWPGYWQISGWQWPDKRIVSPLGWERVPDRVWLATPAVKLLTDLQKTGHWPDFQIYDSWTSPDHDDPTKVSKFKPSDWATWLRKQRTEYLLDLESVTDPDQYDEIDNEFDRFKTGYAKAIQILLGPKPGQKPVAAVKRPDMYRLIRSQHFANLWRKVWALTQQGIPVLSIHQNDAIHIWRQDYEQLVKVLADNPNAFAPFRLDNTKHQLGTFKLKGPAE